MNVLELRNQLNELIDKNESNGKLKVITYDNLERNSFEVLETSLNYLIEDPIFAGNDDIEDEPQAFANNIKQRKNLKQKYTVDSVLVLFTEMNDDIE